MLKKTKRGKYNIILAYRVLSVLVSLTGVLVLLGLFSHAVSFPRSRAVNNPIIKFEQTSYNISSGGNQIKLIIDPGGYPLGFVRSEFTFDATKIKLNQEITTTTAFNRKISVTSMAQANSSGRVSIVLGLDPNDRNNPPTTLFELASLSFVPNTTSTNQSTTLSFVQANMQVVETNYVNLTFAVSNSTILVNPTSTSTPTRIVTATPRPINTPTLGGPTPTLTVGGSDYLIIERSALLALPTNTTGWNALKSAADASGGSPDLCNQDNRTHPGTTLAAALVYARTGQQSYADKAKSMIFAAMPTLVYPCSYASNAALSLGRQLGAYVIAADLIKLNDSSFRSWLSDVRTRIIGDTSHPDRRTLRQTAETGSHNWSTFCLASVIAADRFLGDTAMLDEDWRIFSGYGIAWGWPFQKSGDYQEIWSCVPSDSSKPTKLPISINTACTKSGYNLDGVQVEDASRTAFPTLGNYPAESAQGYVVQALLLSRAGFDAWNVNNQQVKRNALARERFGNLNYSGADYYVQWMINKFYGLSQTTRPAGYGRVFGYTDWLLWGR